MQLLLVLLATDQAIRATGITASEIPIIAGVSPWGSRAELWARKRGLLHDIEQTEAMALGHRLEPVIVDLSVDALPDGAAVRVASSPSLRHHAEVWMIATPDRIITPTDPFQDSWFLECKAVGRGSAHAWEDEPPEYVLAQVQWQMAVTGLLRCDVAALIASTSFRVYTVAADPEVQPSFRALAVGVLAIGR